MDVGQTMSVGDRQGTDDPDGRDPSPAPRPPADTVPLRPGGARRFRVSVGLIAVVCLVPVAATGAIAIGGLGVDDAGEQAQQVAAAAVAALGAVVTLVGVLRTLSSVHGHALEAATLRTADRILMAGARLGWLALVVLGVVWALRVHWDPGDRASRTALNALAIAIPISAVAIVATLARRIPARLVPR